MLSSTIFLRVTSQLWSVWEQLAGQMHPVIRAVELSASPSLTKGKYCFDYGDTAGVFCRCVCFLVVRWQSSACCFQSRLHPWIASRIDSVFRAVAPPACPSLTKGKYCYDHGDTAGNFHILGILMCFASNISPFTESRLRMLSGW
jgi:predicted alternative tryptophan synthase beta-subunit